MIAADQIELRLLTDDDLPAAMRLKNLANWNQTTADWSRLLKLEPEGCFAAVLDEVVVGTTTTTTYGRTLAWIGMVLVDPSFRRLGIATRLLKKAIEYATSRVDTVKLDATPDGQPVYERLGFSVEGRIERWMCDRSGGVGNVEQSKIADDVRSEVIELDRQAFGADRSQLLEKLIEDSRVELVRSSDGGVVAYALGRAGTRASYFGPAVVSSRSDAEVLLDRVLGRVEQQRVYVDFNTTSVADSSVLVERGFSLERDLVRMSYGKASTPTSPYVFAIAGPEVG
jgi:ribosomal protein S18 acetylase RimI-like enzyme